MSGTTLRERCRRETGGACAAPCSLTWRDVVRNKHAELLAPTAGRMLDTCLDQGTKCPLYKDPWKKCSSGPCPGSLNSSSVTGLHIWWYKQTWLPFPHGLQESFATNVGLTLGTPPPPPIPLPTSLVVSPWFPLQAWPPLLSHYMPRDTPLPKTMASSLSQSLLAA